MLFQTSTNVLTKTKVRVRKPIVVDVIHENVFLQKMELNSIKSAQLNGIQYEIPESVRKDGSIRKAR